jgi:all-trans-8'-apo-beta-carotenal 15,15'-oxygenase
VLAWAGRLFSLYESGLPHELDPATLNTVGESTVGGQLETPVLAAHYRVVSQPGGGAAGGGAGARDWVAFSANTGLGGTSLLFYEFEEASGRAKFPPAKFPLPDTPMALIHDIAVTEDYYVVHVGPLGFSGRKFVTGAVARGPGGLR